MLWSSFGHQNHSRGYKDKGCECEGVGKGSPSGAWSSKEIPNKILPALYLSYQDLPSQLEQCFLCSTLFSRTFTRPFAVSVWISEGFITPNGDTALEELGNDSYRELVRRNIFMVNPTHYDESACMMHDLVRGLAVSMGQGAHYSGDLQGLKNSPTKPRHISLVDDGLSTIPNEIVDCDSLRTLICRTPQLRNIRADLFEKHRRLRVLVFSWTKIERLPRTIGYLIHLIYLNVSCTRLEELPESMGLLRNLQFLVLHGCKCLHNLPNSIVRLPKLRSIVLLNTPISQMPKGIGELKDLQVLSGFVLGDKRSVSNQGSTMEDLKHLTQLTNLVCYHLERVPSGTEAKEAALGSKPSLRYVELHCDEQQSPEEEEKDRIKQVFEGLCPPPCIENIEIHFFFGRELPRWLVTTNSSSLSNLRWLKLTNCEYIQRLPSLGLLPQLKYLSIQGASKIVAVGPEFFGESGGGFPKLEEMYIKDMPNWEDWHLTQWPNDGVPLLPCLRKLALEDCPKLKSIPGTLIRRATSLKDLHICKAGNLSNLVERSASITKAVILDCPLLEDISNLAQLQHLDIGGCPAIKRMDNMCSLKYLLLRDKEMEAMPNWMQSIMMQLQRLELWVNPDFIRQCLPLNGPGQPKIILHNPSRIFDETVESLLHTRSPYSFQINLTQETMEGVTVLPLDETSQHSQI
ncbi:Disease resistance protein RGA2 [Acorus gramineus]|uniref:Disease resistance protein RGA2 n=1 Tax=Acorus gramineus TaxID=55184 RepID=A0AAV9A8S6_ACOGR|nr:Disease resistance protein RGA2 [Acorus gramineus]